VTSFPNNTALLVDDDPDALAVFSVFLKELEFSLVSFTNPLSAYQWAVTGEAEIAVLNYFMPRIHGDLLCQLLRALPYWKNIPIIIQTRSEVFQESDPLACGASAIISANCRLSTLSALLDRFLA
jgi:two-component system, OmpR family, alkaline phosphatase synthesis response regulator PhoP